MTLCALFQAVQGASGELIIPSSWAQGRTTFGGLVAALLYVRMRGSVAQGRATRSLAITFVAPVAPEVSVSFQAEILREGKAVSQVLGRALQDGQVVALMQGSFGMPRESSVAVEAQPAPVFKPPAECRVLPQIPGLTPPFTRYLDVRWALGGLPFTHDRSREMGGWVRLQDDARVKVLDEAHLLLLVDAWPPAVLSHLQTPASGSSLTWTIEFIQPLSRLGGDEWYGYRALIEHARDGYGHIAAGLWSQAGDLLAISRQTVTVFG